jgi:hypothetical protein
MKDVKKKLLIFLSASSFFALSLVLSVYSANMSELALVSLIAPLLMAIFFSLLVRAISNHNLGAVKGDFFSSLFIFSFFSYSLVFYMMNVAQISSLLTSIQNDFFVILVWLSSVEIAFFLVKGTRKDLVKG